MPRTWSAPPRHGQAGPRPGRPRRRLRVAVRPPAAASLRPGRRAVTARGLRGPGRLDRAGLPRQVMRSVRARVLPLWETFLIQMNDFDRYLESGLRRMLDPVVASGAPSRRRRTGSGLPLLAVVSAPVALMAEALPVVEPVALPVQTIQLIP